MEAPLKVLKFVGGNSVSTLLGFKYDVVVTTPEAFFIALTKAQSGNDAEGLFSLFSLYVFDEVHHCRKSDAYKKIVDKIKLEDEKLGEQKITLQRRRLIPSISQKPLWKGRPLLIGLTASVTYALDRLVSFYLFDSDLA